MKAPRDTTPYPQDPRSRPIDPTISDGGYVYVRDGNGTIRILPDGPHMHPLVLGGGRPAMYAGVRHKKEVTMLVGYGWCVLRSSREPYRAATTDTADEVDDLVYAADRDLWARFRQWMASNEESFIKWDLHEQVNNHRGILLFCVSRNHRSSLVWDMIQWIAEHGCGSYGLFYAHDDEDQVGNSHYGRGINDFSNVFRVHRIANEEVTELPDPFLSPIVPTVNPSELA